MIPKFTLSPAKCPVQNRNELLQENNVHTAPDLANVYIVPSSQIGDSWRKDVEVLTIQPEKRHKHFTIKLLLTSSLQSGQLLQTLNSPTASEFK